jgi:two-component system sensor histidine kinase MtrB
MPGMRSLRQRATIAWAVLALALTAGVALSAYLVTRQRLVSERERSALDRAFVNARAMRTALRTEGADLTDVLSSLETNADSTVLVNVAGDWFAGSVGRSPESLPPQITEAVRGGRAAHQRVRYEDGVSLVIGVPISTLDARYFEIVPMADLDRVLAVLRERLALTAVAAALLGAAGGWYASGRVLRPTRLAADAAEALADGDLSRRMPASRDRDLQVIELAFNRMAESVQQRIDREARFTSDVSHELRAPVAAMLSAINIARRAQARSGDDDDLLDGLEERVQVLHRTVEDLLEISRVEAGVATLQLEPVDPARLVEAVLTRSGLDVPVDVDGPIAPLALDKRRVAQMVQNLLDNAARYAGGATRVHVDEHDGMLRIAVEDAGPGVAPTERAAIFGRFARGEAAAETGASGTGLGLALVAEHAALHGGGVHLDDAAGGGARFIIELPVTRPW